VCRDPTELPGPATCSQQAIKLRVRETLFPFKLTIKTTTKTEDKKYKNEGR
jgi:hypothetical protein